MFKFTVSPEQTATLESRVKDQFRSILNDQRLMNQIGEFSRDRIVFQARTRKPLNVQASFPSLSPDWVKRRKKLATVNSISDLYASNRSNLTLTGQLLDGYNYRVSGPGEITLEFLGIHKGYTNLNGSKNKDVPNKVIADGLKKQGYVLLDRSVETNKVIQNRIKSLALTFLRKALRTKVSV